MLISNLKKKLAKYLPKEEVKELHEENEKTAYPTLFLLRTVFR
jgi:hypothetical protein